MIKVIRMEPTFQDFPHPSKIALAVYVAGCSNNCIGCHNKNLWHPEDVDGEYMDLRSFENTLEYKNMIYKTCGNIVFTGGDMLWREDSIQFLKDFCRTYKHKYNICVYTGKRLFVVKELFDDPAESPQFWKIGSYEYKRHRESGKDDEKFVLASPNQNFYDSKFKQLSENGILYFNDNWFKKLKRRLNEYRSFRRTRSN